MLNKTTTPENVSDGEIMMEIDDIDQESTAAEETLLDRAPSVMMEFCTEETFMSTSSATSSSPPAKGETLRESAAIEETHMLQMPPTPAMMAVSSEETLSSTLSTPLPPPEDETMRESTVAAEKTPIEISSPPAMMAFRTQDTFASTLSTPSSSPTTTSTTATPAVETARETPDSGEWHEVETNDFMSYGSDDSFRFDSDNESLFEEAEDPMMLTTKPFDMALLKNSIQNGITTLDRVTSKDVVLVVGKTGSGKSTLIQGIAGKKLKEAVHTVVSNGQTFHKLVFEAEHPLEGFDIGHAKTSKTKAINCFERPTGKKGDDSVMMYVDSPGFEDSDGPEMDIATSVMLSQVAKLCKSLRFVILINYASLLEDRGGAMCAVLKFLRAFVRDFNEEKRSFLFLFSHTNEILPDNIDGARKRLLGEIVHTYEGTTDEDVKTVLSFMRKSIEKRYPFVEIFYPLKTDLSKLTKFIETKLAPVKNPTLAANCGLTLSSRLKLTSEAKTMMIDLKQLLSKSPADTNRVKEIRETLDYLGRHIGFRDILNGIIYCDEAIDRFCAQEKLVIEEEIDRGTDLERDFGSENTRALTNAMHHLSELQDLSRDHFSDQLNRRLESFQSHIMNDVCDSFCLVPLKLEKLQAWALAFPEYAFLFDDAMRHYANILQECAREISAFDGIALEKATEKELTGLVRIFKLLESVGSNKEGLVEHGLCIKGAMDAYRLAGNALLLAISTWEDAAASILHADGASLEELVAFATRAKVLDILLSLFDEHSVCGELKDRVTCSARAIETSIVGYYQEVAAKWAKSSLQLNEESASRIGVLIKAADSFEGLHASNWRETRFACTAVMSSIRSKILQKERDVDAVFKSLENHGISNGVEAGKALVSFDRCICFDDLLDPKDRFVKNTSIKFHREYSGRISQFEKIVDTELSNLLDPKKDSSKALDRLKHYLPEVQEIAKFATVIGNMEYATLGGSVDSKLEDYVEKLGRRTRACLKSWNEAVEGKPSLTKIESETCKLDSFLCEIRQVTEIGASTAVHAKARLLYSETTGALTSFSRKVDSEFASHKYYSLLATRLACIEAFGHFSRTSKYLPNLEEMKRRTGVIVSDDAGAVEKLVETTSHWDDIDELLSNLEKATVLDKYIEGQVSSRLGPLRKLRQNKETVVDSLLVEMIDKKDFKGIDEFLAPLADSKDQVKIKKFHQHRVNICKSLHELLHRIECSIGSSSAEEPIKHFVGCLQCVEDAQRNLGKYLRPDLDLDAEIRTMKKKIDDRVLKFLANFSEALKEANFTKMAVSRKRASMFVQLAGNYVSWKVRGDNEKAGRQYQQKVLSASKHLDKFFDSKFSDGADFLQLLSGLKVASDSGHIATSDLAKEYKKVTKTLAEKLKAGLDHLDRNVHEQHCFGDGIDVLYCLIRELDSGLNRHINVADLPFDCDRKLQDWRQRLQEDEQELDFQGPDMENKLKTWSEKLDKMRSPSTFRAVVNWFLSATYENHCRLLLSKVKAQFSHGMASLQTRDFPQIQACIEFLDLVVANVARHVPMAAKLSTELKGEVQTAFSRLLESAVSLLSAGDLNRFKGLFGDIRGFVLFVPCALGSAEAQKNYNLVNQLVFQTLNSQIKTTLNLLAMESDCFDFSTVRFAVEQARVYGNFVADRFTLFFEEVKISQHVVADKWLDAISGLCHEYFHSGRDLARIKLYAILGVIPSSNEQEVRRAYKAKAKIYHPDKRQEAEEERDGDVCAMFRRVKEAYDALLEATSSTKSDPSRPFDQYINRVNDTLRQKIRDCLLQQDYAVVEKVLFSLPSLSELKGLVTPELDWKKIHNDVEELVQNHVGKVKVDVDSLWAARKYRDLNDTIADLRMMEHHFKSHRNIFPSSWNDGIVQAIEEEIKTLGKQARGFLSSKATAKENENEFRHCFVQMGSVLVELPLFKEFTKRIMSDVLESCLHSEWGFSYLFELGLSLQRGGDDDDEDEARIAHFILAEFSHFKEVLTMAWNTETTQKPAEDTVMSIAANHLNGPEFPVDIDREALLKSFMVFENDYRNLLGVYVRPEAHLDALIQQVLAVCTSRPMPISLDGGWDEDIRNAIPQILAGVFALFTVCKSGESFNRIESSEEAAKLGEQLLMKPHNIQVLTLLYMFGCGSPSSDSLDSQLLQIRTGEGKSMILGAAAALLGLLGFTVRCVCYSEYLSNRDYGLFEEVFNHFGLSDRIKYSKITALSEDTTASKGDIRGLTLSLLRGQVTVRVAPSLQPRQKRLCETVKTDPETEMPTDDSRARVCGPDIPPQERRDSLVGATDSFASTRTNDQDLYRGVPPNDDSLANFDKRGRDELNPAGNPTEGDSGTPKSPTKKQKPDGSERDIQNKDVPPHTKLAASADLRRFAEQDSSAPNLQKMASEEILLVDEVDVFFGAEFYGQTYNQVAQLREPEIQDILKSIWKAHKNGGRKQRLAEIKTTTAYKQLVLKLPGFEDIVDNEISLMLDQVRGVDDEPYFLDGNDRIGYKVMDTISYDVTFGYRTVFSYLKESDAGALKDNDRTLQKALCMNISCGQFSYADIHPARILGVSGTLEAMGEFERDVLGKYGIGRFIYMPSVYGQSNFDFQKTGEGIFIESGKSDYYHKICSEISRMTKQKRAVIVFFRDTPQLNEFEASAFYRKLGRQKAKLSENMTPDEKDFVIKKAATAGQLTICSAVFGRGTDFFCKDQRVQDNGGVHIIQTFLSAEKSEEIQIQGRTARQGKKGTYQLILLDSDLEDDFELPCLAKEQIPKNEWYDWLCAAREKRYGQYCSEIEDNLVDATKRDMNAHKYFDALLNANRPTATKLFKEIYFSMKKPMPSSIGIDLGYVVDVTGSMGVYMEAATQTIKALVEGNTTIVSKLRKTFPEIDFKLRMATLAFRDIEDSSTQFHESLWSNSSRFNDDVQESLRFIESATQSPSGGFDLAEDVLGAVHRCAGWSNADDWTAAIKIIMLLTDAPAHGMVPPCSTQVVNADNFATLHPEGLTAETVVDTLVAKEIDLFFCSFNPLATAATEEKLSKLYLNHPSNNEEREISCIPMIQKQQHQQGAVALYSGQCQHIIFVLDESGSMSHSWSGVVVAYQNFLARRLQNQSMADLVSVIQFDDTARITVQKQPIRAAPTSLGYSGGGTCYSPAAESARNVALATPPSHVPVVVFMSDGCTGERDAISAASTFSTLNQEVRGRTGSDLELHVIAFGPGLDQRQLLQITQSSPKGTIHTSTGTAQLSNIFVDIAKSSQNVAAVLEAEIGRRISDAVADKLMVEYLG